MFEIESNVPMPEPSRGRRPIYPFGQMRVGDSVLVPDKRAVSAAHLHGTRNGMKFTSLKGPDGYRVWRIA